MPRRHDPWPPFVQTVNEFVEAGDHEATLPLLDRALEQLQAVRDRELLDAIAEGHTHEELGAALGVSRQAITQQVASARRREIARRRGS